MSHRPEPEAGQDQGAAPDEGHPQQEVLMQIEVAAKRQTATNSTPAITKRTPSHSPMAGINCADQQRNKRRLLIPRTGQKME